jgi:hypothetical protein
MREFRSYGSVRGAPGDGRPYRDSAARFPLVAAPDLQSTIRTTVYLTTIAASTDNDLSATSDAKKKPAGTAQFARSVLR